MHVVRHGDVDVSAVVVAGATGVVVVDTLGSPRDGAALRGWVGGLTELPVVAVISTHAHWDHTFGLAAFADVATYGHHRLGEHLREHETVELAAGRRGDLAHVPTGAWDDVVLRAPDVGVAAPTRVELGGRVLELLPLAPAHTTCDLVVRVVDAGVWVVGDVVEESGPPSVEVDSDPAGWAVALRGLVARMGPDDVVVPGHGAPVTRAFVAAQADDLAALAR